MSTTNSIDPTINDNNPWYNIYKKLTLYSGATWAILTKVITTCVKLFCPKGTKPYTIDQLNSFTKISTKRLILIRHSQSVWNDTVSVVKKMWKLPLNGLMRMASYLLRESFYFPTQKSLFFDTPLTPLGLSTSVKFHDWLNSTRPETQFANCPQALEAVALLRGPNWVPSSIQTDPTTPPITPHPDVVPATMVTSHLRRTILTLSLVLQSRLQKISHLPLLQTSSQSYQISNRFGVDSDDTEIGGDESDGQDIRNNKAAAANNHINKTPEIKGPDEMMEDGSYNRITKRTPSQPQTSSPTTTSSSSPTTTLSSPASSPKTTTSSPLTIPSATTSERIYINSSCKEMSANIDCLSLTPLGQIPNFSYDDCHSALCYFKAFGVGNNEKEKENGGKELKEDGKADKDDQNGQNRVIIDEDDQNGQKNQPTHPNHHIPSPLPPIITPSTMESILRQSCDMTHYKSQGSTTDDGVLEGFSEWIFDHPNSNFILCGHSSWLKRFFIRFVPDLTMCRDEDCERSMDKNEKDIVVDTTTTATIATTTSSTAAIPKSKPKSKYPPTHLANLLQTHKVPNTGCYSVELVKSIDPDDGNVVYWLNPDSIYEIWGGTASSI